MTQKGLGVCTAWLVGLMLTVVLHPLFALSAQTLPGSIQKCIPTQSRLPIERTEILGTTRTGGIEYYLLAAFGTGETEPSDLLITVKGDRCQTLLFNPTGDRIALASKVPRPVAQKLVLARYQTIVKQRGKANLQREVNKSAQNAAWFEEEVWALQQLGIKVPSGVKVIPK